MILKTCHLCVYIYPFIHFLCLCVFRMHTAMRLIFVQNSTKTEFWFCGAGNIHTNSKGTIFLATYPFTERNAARKVIASQNPRLGDLTPDPDDLPESSPSPVDLAGERRPDLKRGLITPITFPPFAKRRSPSRLDFHSLARRQKLLVLPKTLSPEEMELDLQKAVSTC